MKVRVKESMNIRRRASATGESLGILEPGFEFEIESVLEGSLFKDSTIWCMDKFGFFYWTGGLLQLDDKRMPLPKQDWWALVPKVGDPAKMTVDLPWYIRDYKIDEIWKKTKGEGVKIAILDTGIDQEHPDLAGSVDIGDAKNFWRLDVLTERDFLDKGGHGTWCAGIAAARGKEKVVGVAPMAKLIVGKVLGNTTDAIWHEDLKRALTWAVEQGADVISMSFAIPQDQIELVRANITEVARKNIIMVAATGNDSATGNNVAKFPSKFEDVIPVGAVDKLKALLPISNFDTLLSIIHCPGNGIPLASPRSVTFIPLDGGTSFATAFLAGVIALSIAKKSKRGLSRDLMLSHLINSSSPPRHDLHRNLNFNLINPLALFNLLNP